MIKFFELMLNEIRFFITDKGALLIMIIGVMAYSLCYAIPYHHEIIREIPTGLIDLDQTQMSRTFERDLHITDTIHIVSEYTSLQEAEKELFRSKIKGFIIIPEGFEKDLLQGKQTNVALYGDSSYLIIYKTLYAKVLETAIETGGKIEVAKMMKKGMPKKQAIALKQPFEFVQMPLYNPAGGYQSYAYPIILILILHQTLLIGLGLMQGTRNEKRKKYCQDDKEIPLTILARSTVYIALYSIYGALFLLVYPSIFVYPINYNILPMIIIYLLMMYCAAFFGQTISYWFKTRETAILIMVSCSIILIFIPGLIWPREAIPTLINWFSFFIPVTCGADALVKLNQNGASFMNVIYDYFWLIFLSTFYYITAIILTRKSNKEYNE